MQPETPIRDLPLTLPYGFLDAGQSVFQLLDGLGALFESGAVARALDLAEYRVDAARRVYVSASASVSAGASIDGCVLVGPGATVRAFATLRGPVVVGPGAVVGGAVEVKNAVLGAGAQVPHLSYVGDALLGAGAHLGAGAMVSNLRLDGRGARLRLQGSAQTRRKLGAVLCDGAQLGCNAVLCPGAVLGRGAAVGPCCAFAGALQDGQQYLGGLGRGDASYRPRGGEDRSRGGGLPQAHAGQAAKDAPDYAEHDKGRNMLDDIL